MTAVVESFAEDTPATSGARRRGADAPQAKPARTIPETSKEPRGKLVADREGRLWVGTRGDGVLRVSGGSDVTVERFSGPGVFGNDLVLAVFQDREGNIWVGRLVASTVDRGD